MKLLNTERKLKIVLGIATIIYFFLVLIKEIFFTLEYLLNKIKNHSKMRTTEENIADQKIIIKIADNPIHTSAQKDHLKEFLSSVSNPRKTELPEPIQIHIYRFNKFKQ